MATVLEHGEFSDWFGKQTDEKLITAVSQRILRVAGGNFGDVKSIGAGLFELRIHYGAGYRIYYTMRGLEIVILLCAGWKSNQKKDIKKAKELKKEV
jgi:putative addiction module killer protein